MNRGDSPAFPSPPIDGATDDRLAQRDGLTKREWLAGMALNGVITTTKKEGDWYAIVADHCVRYADAILAELEKEPTS